MTRYSSWVPLILRLSLASIFFVHGTSKWGMWEMQPSEQAPAMMIAMMKILSVVEPLGALALILGVCTTFASMGLSVVMFGAINIKMDSLHLQFMEQQSTGWELEFMVLTALISLMILGPGTISLDHRLLKPTTHGR